MNWRKIKTIILKSCVVLFYTTTMNRFSIWLWCAMNSGFYRTISDNQLSDWTKKKPNLHTHKKGYGHCLVACCQFDPLQLSKSLRNYYIWEGCSKNRTENCTACSQLCQQKGPNSSQRPTDVTQPTLQKLNEFGYEVSPHLSYPHQPTTTSSSLTTLCRENPSASSRRQKMLSKSSLNSEAQMFVLQE